MGVEPRSKARCISDTRIVVVRWTASENIIVHNKMGRTRNLLLCVVVVISTVVGHADASIARRGLALSPSWYSVPRGGETSVEKEESSNKKPKKKKKKRSKRSSSIPSTKVEVSQAMKEKDAATALGDAIRDRANVLRSDMHLSRIDDSVSSVGWAMGASDYSAKTGRENEDKEEEEGGGVEAAPTSVLANYFLQSHGGAHALQCACSLLATLTAAGAIVLPQTTPKSSRLKLTCLKRSLQFAMTKHVSGLLAASTMAASAIPTVGLRQARKWMEKLSVDPVSQYLFYTALLLLWMPSANKTDTTTWWWWQPPVGKYSPALMVGPILLREAISTGFVVSDVLVLLTTSREESGVPVLLRAGQSVVNIVMSLLVTPSVWRNSSATERQQILAKVTSRLCLLLELAVGLLLGMDGVLAFWEQTFSSSTSRPPLVLVLKRFLCARLYLNYLWVKRRKVVKLAAQVRGGASQFPIRVLQVLLEPRASMGLEPRQQRQNALGTVEKDKQQDKMNSWKDYAQVAFGFEDE